MAYERWRAALHKGEKKEFVLGYYKKCRNEPNFYGTVYGESKKHFLGMGFGEQHAHMLASATENECRELERRRGISAEAHAGHKYHGFLDDIGGIAREYFEKHEAEIGSPGFLEKIRGDAYKHIYETENFGEKESKIIARNIMEECGQILRVRNEAEKYLEKYAGRLGEHGILETIYADALKNSIESEKRPGRAAEAAAGRIMDECEMLIKRREAGAH